MNTKGCKFTSGHIMRDRRLEVGIFQHLPHIEAVVLSDNPQTHPISAKSWTLENDGILEYCECAKPCQQNESIIKPELPHYIDAQMQREIARYRNKFGIPLNKVRISIVNETSQLPLPLSSYNFKLTGDWKKKSLILKTRKEFDALPDNDERVLLISQYGNLIKDAQRAVIKREFAQAETSLKKAILIMPESPEAYYELGYLYKRQGRLKEAKKHLISPYLF